MQPVLIAHIRRQRAERLFARHGVGAVRALFERVGKAAVRPGEAQQRVEHAAAALDKARVRCRVDAESAQCDDDLRRALGAFAVVAEAAVFHLAGRERAERQLDRLAHGALDGRPRRLIRYGEGMGAVLIRRKRLQRHGREIGADALAAQREAALRRLGAENAREDGLARIGCARRDHVATAVEQQQTPGKAVDALRAEILRFAAVVHTVRDEIDCLPGGVCAERQRVAAAGRGRKASAVPLRGANAVQSAVFLIFPADGVLERAAVGGIVALIARAIHIKRIPIQPALGGIFRRLRAEYGVLAHAEAPGAPRNDAVHIPRDVLAAIAAVIRGPRGQHGTAHQHQKQREQQRGKSLSLHAVTIPFRSC